MMQITVVYAERDQQWLKELSLARGSSVEDAIMASKLLKEVPALQSKSINDLELGVFAESVKLEDLLAPGDRVEIYRPLTADPKEVRRQLAKLGKSMGQK